MAPQEIVEAGNTFVTRFFVALLLAHFVVIASTFDPPPKLHAIVGDAKSQRSKERILLAHTLKADQRALREISLLAAALPQLKRSATHTKKRGNTKNLEQGFESNIKGLRAKFDKDQKDYNEASLKFDQAYLEFEKAKAPRQFAIPGLTTIDSHDILKLYPAAICLGLLRILLYRRRLIVTGRPKEGWPFWSAPITYSSRERLPRVVFGNLAWFALVSILFFAYADVARREEFYLNSRLFVVNLVLFSLIVCWYIVAFSCSLASGIGALRRGARGRWRSPEGSFLKIYSESFCRSPSRTSFPHYLVSTIGAGSGDVS
ncbi:MAG: hypothetical protein DMG88_01450 [Acidobacteria bacterium]|nr:MAG: hypothetical protein DMG88_01450 [Acidobacteriota bacterium]